MKFIEKDTCNFLDKPCTHKIIEEELKELMKDPEAGIIFNVPVDESQTCMNCLLSMILVALTDMSLSMMLAALTELSPRRQG